MDYLDYLPTLVVASAVKHLFKPKCSRTSGCGFFWHPAGNTTPSLHTYGKPVAPSDAHANLRTYERRLDLLGGGDKGKRKKKVQSVFSPENRAHQLQQQNRVGFNQRNSPSLRSQTAAPLVHEPPRCIFTHHYGNIINTSAIHPHLGSGR